MKATYAPRHATLSHRSNASFYSFALLKGLCSDFRINNTYGSAENRKTHSICVKGWRGVALFPPKARGERPRWPLASLPPPEKVHLKAVPPYELSLSPPPFSDSLQRDGQRVTSLTKSHTPLEPYNRRIALRWCLEGGVAPDERGTPEKHSEQGHP